MNEQEAAMVEAFNAVRSGRGLHSLLPAAELAAAARRHAADLAAHPGLLHVGSDGSSIDGRMRDAGYEPLAWREVVGWGFRGDVGAMLDWWLASPGHVGIVLDGEVREVGVGYVYAPATVWGHFWCVDLGRREAIPQPEPPPLPRPYTSHAPVVIGAPAPVAAPGIDLLEYLRGDGRAYMVRHPDGNQEKFRTARDGARWLQLKNAQWEEFWYDDGFIWRGVDTSPGDGQYYRQYEDGQEGARWCPRRMTVGQRWESPAEHTVQTYWKADCRAVDHLRNGRTRNRLMLVARHAALTWNGVTVEDVVEVVSVTGETMFFGRGYGLVAWVSAWGSSAISYVLPVQEADNQPESGCFG